MPDWIAPLQPLASWRITQPFIPGQHYGMDFGNADGTALSIGTPVLAIADGTVVYLGDEPGGAGLHTNVNHANGVQSRDFHLSGFNVTVGQDVKQGDVIGFSGNTGSSTGPHLHHEHRINGVAIDPSPFLNAWAPAPPPPEESDVSILFQTPTTLAVLNPPLVTDVAPGEVGPLNALVSAGAMKLVSGSDGDLAQYRALYARFLSTLPKTGGGSGAGATAAQVADEFSRRLTA